MWQYVAQKGFLSCIMCLILSGLLMVLPGCESQKRVVPEIRKGVWFIADDLKLALRFDEDDGILKGSYIRIDKGVSGVYPFEARRMFRKWVFSFEGDPKLDVKGCISVAEDGYRVKTSGRKQIFLRPVPVSVLPAYPGRYAATITKRFLRTAKTYGYASGYYASKPVSDLSASRYPEIILGVVSEVTTNMFSDSIRLDMDIYEPSGDTLTKRPLILLIHGGAFVVGDKRDSLQMKLASWFTRRGYVVASVNYRMGYPFVPGMYSQLDRCMYRAVQDIRAALRYLAAHKKLYRIDPDKVFLAGNSAGGFLSLLAAFMDDHERWESTGGLLFGMRKELGCLDCSTNRYKGKYRIAGVVNLWGGITDLDIISAGEKIPALLIHGTADRIVPFGYDYPFKNVDSRLTAFFSRKLYGSESIASHMQKQGSDVTLIPIPGGSHEPYQDDTVTYPMIRREMTSFFFRILAAAPLKIVEPSPASMEASPARYTVQNCRGETLYWRCKGGLILRQGPASVEVVWIQTASDKILTVFSNSPDGLVRRDVYHLR